MSGRITVSEIPRAGRLRFAVSRGYARNCAIFEDEADARLFAKAIASEVERKSEPSCAACGDTGAPQDDLHVVCQSCGGKFLAPIRGPR
jgi:DNA-directed RNA polymerase subunit RPC12/RpoP